MIGTFFQSDNYICREKPFVKFNGICVDIIRILIMIDKLNTT